MYPEEFQKRLQLAFDRRVVVSRDRADHCLVVWDRTRSGTPYAAYKVACEHHNPSLPGSPRDPQDTDLVQLRKMDWATRYNRRRGAVAQVMRQFYKDPEEQRIADMFWRAEETTEQVAKPYMEWRAGVRNTISLAPGSKAGGMKNRHHDGQRRIKARLTAAGLL